MTKVRIAYLAAQTVTVLIVPDANTFASSGPFNATEVSTGIYEIDLSDKSLSENAYSVLWRDTGETVGVSSVYWSGSSLVSLYESVDALGESIAALGEVEVVLSSPVAVDGSIEIIRGDDYLADDGRALSFTFSGVPDLSGGVLELTARNEQDSTVVFLTTANTPTEDGAVFEIARSQTIDLPAGNYRYDIQATLSNESVITLQRGILTLLEDTTLNED